ncbi:MAG: DUF4358 domain-containing protein [Ruminococcus sp.]|nr:DUF4358 domain-containing protein [Ruminococcus sp.]MCM1381630.1 DUF4358 domain-containing protein [Muribaculaceae bacterium]MCM1479251.1 DUF4358 domain-containing protein [Muribaculaceae bacterium]
MKFRKFFTAAAVLAACALILTACGKESTEETTSAETETETSAETATAAETTEETVPEEVSEDTTEEEISDNPLQPIADAALAVGEWPMLWEVDDPMLISDFFLLDAENDNYQNMLILQCPMSANMTEIILIKAEDVSAAKADLEARRKKAQEQDAFYPDDVERAGASIVGTEGDYAYFLMGDNAASAETEIVNYIKNME